MGKFKIRRQAKFTVAEYKRTFDKRVIPLIKFCEWGGSPGQSIYHTHKSVNNTAIGYGKFII